jgi:hypothetical protein
LIRTDAKTAAFALIEHKEHTYMKPKNMICLWFDKDAQEAARLSWQIIERAPTDALAAGGGKARLRGDDEDEEDHPQLPISRGIEKWRSLSESSPDWFAGCPAFVILLFATFPF